MEVAGTVVFLASSAALLITGETILIDGGWTARSSLHAHASCRGLVHNFSDYRCRLKRSMQHH